MTRLETLAMRERLGWIEPVEARELARLRAEAREAERERAAFLHRLWAEQDRQLAARIAEGRARRGPPWAQPMGPDDYLDLRTGRVVEHPESHEELRARYHQQRQQYRNAMVKA